jgi:hypothetical protein
LRITIRVDAVVGGQRFGINAWCYGLRCGSSIVELGSSARIVEFGRWEISQSRYSFPDWAEADYISRAGNICAPMIFHALPSRHEVLLDRSTERPTSDIMYVS